MKKNLISILYFFVYIFLINSCQKYDALEVRSGVSFVKFRPLEISEVILMDWMAGDFYSTKLSKGFQMGVPIPRLEDSDLNFLKDKYKIDSIILKVSRRGNTSGLDLGTYRVPLVWIPNYPTGEIKLNILYTTAYHSNGFVFPKCPDDGHRFFIDDLELQKGARPGAIEMAVDVAPYNRLLEDLELPQQGAIKINAGQSLMGRYRVELALFSSETKLIHSSFKEIMGEVRVNSEKRINLSGCP